MPREKRPVIAVNTETGESKIYESTYACAKAIGVNPTLVLSAAVNNGGVCNGYQIYDTPETIERRIEELKNLKEYIKEKGL